MSLSLWRDRDFMSLWLGETISQIGSTVTRDALPLTAVLSLGASPFQMGLLGAAGTAPVLVLGLFAGVWVDRLRRRPLMIAADLARAGLLATIPLAAAVGALHVGQLYVVAALAGCCTVFFDVAYRSYLPRLVESERLLEANARLGTGESIAEFSGAPLAGTLVQAIGGPAAVVVDACSFLWSAACVLFIRKRELPPQRGGESLFRDAAAGLRSVWESSLLRAPAAALATASLFGNMIGATYYLYAVRTLGIGPALLGFVIACGGFGAFPGSLLATRISRRLGTGRALICASLLRALVALLLPLAHRPLPLAVALLAANQFAGDCAYAIYLVNDVSLRQAAAPPGLLGRVNGTVHMLSQGMTPVGLVLGGVLAQLFGLRVALLVAAVGIGLSALWLVLSPVRRVSALPGD